MTEKQEIGKLGENLAVNYLSKQGYRILEQNFKQLPWGEIDIIAKKDNYLVFVEVKTITDDFENSTFLVENKIDRHKKRALNRIIQIYISQHKLPLDIWWQADALIIKIDFEKRKFTLKHIENIFYK